MLNENGIYKARKPNASAPTELGGNSRARNELVYVLASRDQSCDLTSSFDKMARSRKLGAGMMFKLISVCAILVHLSCDVFGLKCMSNDNKPVDW